MERNIVSDMLLREESYAEAMDTVVGPYRAERMTIEHCEREPGKRIFYARALADDPKGIVIISHGFTETIEKHLETIYYFLCGGYHVYMPEHCGHGHSYRLCGDTQDLSLVHVDDYMRYVEDLLFVSRMAAREFPQLPMSIYGHSMGGGIAAAAAANAPELFSKMILTSPMICPKSDPVPWTVASLIAKFFCMTGKSERYLMGHHPYDGAERFLDSASTSEARFDYYQKKRNREPLFQMNAASYGWLWQTARLNRYLQGRAWWKITCPVLIFQAENDTYVSKKQQEQFAGKLARRRNGNVKFVKVPGTKHEIFNSGTKILEDYWTTILGWI